MNFICIAQNHIYCLNWLYRPTLATVLDPARAPKRQRKTYQKVFEHTEKWAKYEPSPKWNLAKVMAIQNWTTVVAHSPPLDHLPLSSTWPLTAIWSCPCANLLCAFLLKLNNAIQVPTAQQIATKDTRTIEREREQQTQQLWFHKVEFICVVLILCGHLIPWTRAVHP